MRKFLVFSSVMVVSLAVAACGDDGGGGEGGSGGKGSGGSGADAKCFDYGSFDGAAPAVNFKADVLPIFQTSCNQSACHGNEAGTLGYLGPQMGDITDAQLMLIGTSVVNADSSKTGIKRIVPNEPENSFLMHKIDGTFECSALPCSGTACGAQMPLGVAPLSEANADTVRRWIAQGAALQ